MKYNLLYFTHNDGVKEVWITPLKADDFKDMPENKRHLAILAKIFYTKANQEEMLQHAQKLADYFEQVDIAKEAVIRCTKI